MPDRDRNCPVCGSPDSKPLDCVDPFDEDSNRSYAICCNCAAAWDTATGVRIRKETWECAKTFRLREPLTEEERLHFADLFGGFLRRLGMEPNQPGTVDTPLRFVDAMIDLTMGYEGDPRIHVVFPKECPEKCGDDQIIEGPIPFWRSASIMSCRLSDRRTSAMYEGVVIRISKLTRIVRLVAKRFTQQERMGYEIADIPEKILKPTGVAVALEAQHLCTQMRGVREVMAKTRTLVWKGAYRTDGRLLNAFFDLAGLRR